LIFSTASKNRVNQGGLEARAAWKRLAPGDGASEARETDRTGIMGRTDHYMILEFSI
jgi:hypothetical protein